MKSAPKCQCQPKLEINLKKCHNFVCLTCKLCYLLNHSQIQSYRTSFLFYTFFINLCNNVSMVGAIHKTNHFFYSFFGSISLFFLKIIIQFIMHMCWDLRSFKLKSKKFMRKGWYFVTFVINMREIF